MRDYVDWEEAKDPSCFAGRTQLEDLTPMRDTHPEPRIFRRKAARRAEDGFPVSDDLPVSDVQPVLDMQPATGAQPDADDQPTPIDVDLQDIQTNSEALEKPHKYNLPARLPEEWERLQKVRPGVRRHILGNLPLISFFRDDPAARSFDLLRSRLLQGIKAKGWKRVAVAAPTKGCGATFTSVNLALSLARIPDSRVVLMDLNQRDPGVASALDIRGHGDMNGFLGGEIELTDHLVRVGDALALGLTDEPDRFAAEMLHGAGASRVLDDMVETLQPDVVIYDLPAVLSHDDFVACLSHVDCVLLVSDAEQTTAAQIARCEEVMGDQTNLLGVILNRSRRPKHEI